MDISGWNQSYKHTSLRHHILTNDVPKYDHFYINITISIQHLLNSILFDSLSITPLTLRVQTVSFMEHASLRTPARANLFMLGLKLLSASTLTHVSQYRPFIKNDISYIQQNATSSHLGNHYRTTFPDLTHHLQSYIYNYLNK